MDVVDRLLRDRPFFHSKGTKRWDSLPGTLRAIHRSVQGGTQTLETGCGASTVVFAAQGARHTTISPDAEEHARVRDYLNQIGVDSSRLTFIVGLSDRVLPSLCTERSLSTAFIDGAHGFPYPAVDWHYVTRALKIGGCLLMDDIPMPAVTWVFRYMRTDPSWRLDGILDDRAAAFTLTDEPAPEYDQPFNRRSDYSFAPLPARARLVLTSKINNIRRAVAPRYPRLQRAWNRVSWSTDPHD
jgi:hypothetical protein